MTLKVWLGAAHQFLNYHDNVACFVHSIAVPSCGFSTDSLSPFCKVGNATLSFHANSVWPIIKLIFNVFHFHKSKIYLNGCQQRGGR
jgi:hypothetical protein